MLGGIAGIIGAGAQLFSGSDSLTPKSKPFSATGDASVKWAQKLDEANARLLEQNAITEIKKKETESEIQKVKKAAQLSVDF